MSKRMSDQLIPAEAKITRWFTTKARNEPHESIKEGKPKETVVNEKATEIVVPNPSTSMLKQTTTVVAENPGASIKLLTEPNQPRNLKFPARSFGKQNFKRSFQPSWFDKFKWLHYDVDSDSAFCFTCTKALQHNIISSTKGEIAFTATGFQNWKKALAKDKGFHKHESSECHREAAARLCNIPSSVKGCVGELISTKHALEKYHSRRILLKILRNVRYLARQALPLRGDWRKNQKSEADSNIYQLLQLRCDEDPSIVEWLRKKTNKFTSADIQNEMLEIMALRILREIAQNVQNSTIYTIMADESADVSNKEQLVFCIRWVDDELVVHEDFIGMHPMQGTSADQIAFIIKDVLLRMNLRLEDARGQCYDGAAAMAGAKTGVATQIKSINGKCLYTHCYGHALNLAVGDSIKSVECLKGVFEVVHEICKLIKKSPKRNTKLDDMRKQSRNDSKGIHALCPTRWTVRGEALESVLNSYVELMNLWDWSIDTLHDTEMKARVRGVQANMPTFDFLYGCCLGILLLKQTDNLSRTLQDPKISAAEGNAIAQDVIKTLSKDRNDNAYNLFWERVCKKQNELNVNDPSLPRKRRLPRRLEDGSAEMYYFPFSPKDHYRQIYFQTLDAAMNCIKERFDQPDFKMYVNLQELFLKAIRDQSWENELTQVCSIYNGDVERYSLEAQLPLLRPAAIALEFELKNFTVYDLIKLFQALDYSRKIAMSEVIKAAKILLVMPATNAISERSFSAMKRVKTYLRSTTTDNRMNHLMLLHVQKERVDNTSLIDVAHEFVERVDSRKQVFGQFSNRDLCIKIDVAHKSTQT